MAKNTTEKIGVPIYSRRLGAVVFVDPDRLEEAKAFHSQEFVSNVVFRCTCSHCSVQESYEERTRIMTNGDQVGYPTVSLD